MIETTNQKIARLEKEVSKLEKALIAARLELGAARPCPLCDKTEAEGCKGYSHPYTCDGTVNHHKSPCKSPVQVEIDLSAKGRPAFRNNKKGGP